MGTGQPPYTEELQAEVEADPTMAAETLEAAQWEGASPLARLFTAQTPPCPECVYDLAQQCVMRIANQRPAANGIVLEMRKGAKARFSA